MIGDDLIVHEFTGRLANEFFFVGEQGIEIEEIHAGETGHSVLLGASGP